MVTQETETPYTLQRYKDPKDGSYAFILWPVEVMQDQGFTGIWIKPEHLAGLIAGFKDALEYINRT